MPIMQKNNGYQILVLSAAYTLVMTPVNVSPFLVSAVMADLSLGEDQVGLVMTIELAMMALVAALAAAFAQRFSIRSILLGGAGVVLAGYGLTISADSLATFVISRIIAGSGMGFLLIGVNFGISALTDPVKNFGFANTLGLAVAAALLLMLPSVVRSYGLFGAYGMIAILVIATLVLVPGLRPDWYSHANPASPMPLPVRPTQIFCLIVALLLAPATYVSFYVFSKPIGELAGLSSQEMGFLLAAIQLGGVGAAALASRLGSKYGVFMPLALALGGQALAILTATLVASGAVFIISFVVLNMLFLFSMPYQLGVGALLDRSGQLGSVLVGTFYFGSAAGPYLGGYLLTHFGAPAIGIGVCIGVTIALACFGKVLYGRETDSYKSVKIT